VLISALPPMLLKDDGIGHAQGLGVSATKVFGTETLSPLASRSLCSGARR
jgi:hypothetical protein